MSIKNGILTIFILSVLFVIDASAQTKFGIRGGSNLGNLRTSFIDNSRFIPSGSIYKVDEKNIALGLVAGIIVERSFFENFSIQAELYYIKKGNTTHLSLEDQNSITNIVRTTTINNIDLPIHLKYKFVINEKLSAFAMTGFCFGRLLSAELARCEDGICVTNGLKFIPEYDDYDDLEMNRGDTGLSVGTGIIFKEKLFLDFRYVSGTRSIWRHNFTGEVKTNGFQIGIGFFLN